MKKPINGAEFIKYLTARIAIPEYALPKDDYTWDVLIEHLDDIIIPAKGMDRILMCVDFLSYDIYVDREFDFLKTNLRTQWLNELSKLNRRTWGDHEKEIKKIWDKIGVVILKSKEKQKDDFCNLCYEIDMIWRGLSHDLLLAGEWLKNPPFQRWCLDNGFEKGDGVEQIDEDMPYTPDNCRVVKGMGAAEKEAERLLREQERREMDEINAKIKYD